MAGTADVLCDTTPTALLIADASMDWNADIGATSHMTPHRHWFSTYKPYKTPINLADGSTVYSAGLGSVRFQPHINGQSGDRVLEFERVLHVPALHPNLLSVLYLTCNKGYTVRITRNRLYFHCNGSKQPLFTASVNERNAAHLDGLTIPLQEYAALASTCPMDKTLWHRRFGHLNLDSIDKIIRQKLVKGLQIQSHTAPDPICEPCIAGKQHQVIPKLAEHCATETLALIHSDLHEMPPPRSGIFRYFITFIDDATRLWVVVPVRAKSDAFAVFKQFKAYAENQTGAKIKALHDDKGGEYMSREFDAFLAAAGILRQHTVRAKPHQNGVAERASCTIVEGITAMLNEAHLPASFWVYALSAFVHVRNRSPTSALLRSTPYKRWYHRKPDVSHLRVFGCYNP